jgi:hypothetical protein
VRLTSRAKACGERKMGLHGEFVLPSLTHSLRRRAKCTYKIVNPVRTVCSHYQNTSKKGGGAAIQEWIDDQLDGKSCNVVLIVLAAASFQM